MTLPGTGVAYQSPGDLSGLTLRTQWQTAFVKKPQWVFVTGWNEHIAQVIAFASLARTFAGLEGRPRSATAS